MNERDIIARQFHSALKMLEQAIAKCPRDVWLSGSPNRFWHVAYHTLFYTHLYLSPTQADHQHPSIARPGYQFLGALPADFEEERVLDQPYTQQELLDYAAFCHLEIDKQTASLDPQAASGFYWIPFNKLELQLYNLRHLAHHTGQLIGRLRAEANIEIGWVR